MGVFQHAPGLNALEKYSATRGDQIRLTKRAFYLYALVSPALRATLPILSIARHAYRESEGQLQSKAFAHVHPKVTRLELGDKVLIFVIFQLFKSMFGKAEHFVRKSVDKSRIASYIAATYDLRAH